MGAIFYPNCENNWVCIHFSQKGSSSYQRQIYTDSHTADELDFMPRYRSDWSKFSTQVNIRDEGNSKKYI